MRPNRLIYVALAILMFFIPMWTAQATGYWSTSGKVDGKGTTITATGRDTAEIKGWMTFGEISQAYGVTLDEIAKQFNLPKDQVTAGQAMNKLESGEFSVSKLRQWLDSRKAK